MLVSEWSCYGMGVQIPTSVQVLQTNKIAVADVIDRLRAVPARR